MIIISSAFEIIFDTEDEEKYKNKAIKYYSLNFI